MKPEVKKILKFITILLLPIVVQAFASSRNKTRGVKQINVEHLTQDTYVTDETVRKMLIKDPQAITPMGLLDLNKLEKTLNEHVMIEKSEVFCTVDGNLEAKIHHRQPIARLYDGEKFFYMDLQGKEMPLSTIFSARVPLVYGSIGKRNWDTTFEFINFIREDDFLNKNITEINVKPNGEYELKMRIPNFTVLFGKFEHAELKKANLKAFYKQLEKTKKLNDFNIVNLKFKNQVVCKK